MEAKALLSVAVMRKGDGLAVMPSMKVAGFSIIELLGAIEMLRLAVIRGYCPDELRFGGDNATSKP